MSDHITQLEKILRASGYSATKPRIAVCELLLNQEPLSMRELAELTHGKLDRASLYRTVALFEKLDIVHRIYIGWKYKVELSDAFTHHHHHISCTRCGAIVAITEEDEIEEMIRQLAAKHHFTAEHHQLEIRGLCAACRSSTARTDS